MQSTRLIQEFSGSASKIRGMESKIPCIFYKLICVGNRKQRCQTVSNLVLLSMYCYLYRLYSHKLIRRWYMDVWEGPGEGGGIGVVSTFKSELS